MSGEPLEVADLSWHGLDGDRRLAFRRLDDRNGFPWLTASKLPELILFSPQRREPLSVEPSRHTFAHQTERNSTYSVKTWQQTSVAAMAQRSR